jgi:hypothetical protein
MKSGIPRHPLFGIPLLKRFSEAKQEGLVAPEKAHPPTGGWKDPSLERAASPSLGVGQS